MGSIQAASMRYGLKGCFLIPNSHIKPQSTKPMERLGVKRQSLPKRSHPRFIRGGRICENYCSNPLSFRPQGEISRGNDPRTTVRFLTSFEMTGTPWKRIAQPENSKASPSDFHIPSSGNLGRLCFPFAISYNSFILMFWYHTSSPWSCSKMLPFTALPKLGQFLYLL